MRKIRTRLLKRRMRTCLAFGVLAIVLMLGILSFLNFPTQQYVGWVGVALPNVLELVENSNVKYRINIMPVIHGRNWAEIVYADVSTIVILDGSGYQVSHDGSTWRTLNEFENPLAHTIPPKRVDDWRVYSVTKYSRQHPELALYTAPWHVSVAVCAVGPHSNAPVQTVWRSRFVSVTNIFQFEQQPSWLVLGKQTTPAGTSVVIERVRRSDMSATSGAVRNE